MLLLLLLVVVVVVGELLSTLLWLRLEMVLRD